MTKYIDINADMGEGYGPYDIGNDAAMLDIISTANLACGFHGGDPVIMSQRCRDAKSSGVRIGAHPGYPDLWGFGRREMTLTRREVEDIIAYQMGALDGVAKLAGYEITHIKVHGAFGHFTADTDYAAEGLITAVKAFRPELIIMVMAGTALEQAAEAEGMRIAREIFADRAYEDNGRLMSRAKEGAMIENPAQAAESVANMIAEGAIIAASGKRIALKGIDSVCTHGDSQNAIAISRAVKARLQNDGYVIRPFADTIA